MANTVTASPTLPLFSGMPAGWNRRIMKPTSPHPECRTCGQTEPTGHGWPGSVCLTCRRAGQAGQEPSWT